MNAIRRDELPSMYFNLRLTESRSNEFTTSDVYAFARELEKHYPNNRHVRDKIRQQQEC